MLILNPERLQATKDPLLPSTESQTPAVLAASVRVAVAVLAAVAAAAAGFAVTQYFAGIWPLWVPFALSAAFVYLATLTTVTIEGGRWHLPFAVVWGGAFALGLPWQASTEAFAVAGLLAVSSVAAYLTYTSESKAYATLHIFSTARGYASTLMTGIVIALLLLYGAQLSRGGPLLPDGVLARFADETSRLIPTFVPSVAPSAGTTTLSVHDLAEASVRGQLEQDARYQALTPAEQQRVLKEATDQAAANFSKQFGMASTSSDTSVGTVTQGAFSKALGGFQDKYGWYFIAAWLLGAFFVARSAAYILSFAVTCLVWATIHVAISLGLLQIQVVPSARERLQL